MPLFVLFAIASLLPTTLHAHDATAPATQAGPVAASSGVLFDTLASRYGVRGDEIADEAPLNARVVELTRALPANDAVRSARLDVYRCITIVDGPDASLTRAEAGLAGQSAQREPLMRMEYLMRKAYAL